MPQDLHYLYEFIIFFFFLEGRLQGLHQKLTDIASLLSPKFGILKGRRSSLYMLQALRKIHHKLDQNYVKFKFRSAHLPIQKISLFIDSNRYVLKTIQSLEEMHTALRLRYEIFIKEALGKKWPIRVDIDHFDHIADHLIVIHKETNQVVGTYRLITSHFSDRFYSETEFDLSKFMTSPVRMLELGRACIHPEHRNGLTLAILWKGIRQYMELAETEVMFGCTSLKTEDPQKALDLALYLQAAGHAYRDHEIHPLPEFRQSPITEVLKNSSYNLSEEDYERGEKLTPILLKSYIKAGAKVVIEPAYDCEMKCYDFFTVLDIRHLNEKYSAYFKR